MTRTGWARQCTRARPGNSLATNAGKRVLLVGLDIGRSYVLRSLTRQKETKIVTVGEGEGHGGWTLRGWRKTLTFRAGLLKGKKKKGKKSIAQSVKTVLAHTTSKGN